MFLRVYGYLVDREYKKGFNKLTSVNSNFIELLEVNEVKHGSKRVYVISAYIHFLDHHLVLDIDEREEIIILSYYKLLEDLKSCQI